MNLNKEVLLKEFESVLNNTETAIGNALYKNALEHNPSITPESSVSEKIESLPEDKQNEFYLFLDEMLKTRYYNKVMGAVYVSLNKMGVI